MSTKTKATADVAEIKPKCVNAIFVVADDHHLVAARILLVKQNSETNQVCQQLVLPGHG